MMTFWRRIARATAVAGMVLACRGSTRSPPAPPQSEVVSGSAASSVDDRPELEALIRKAAQSGGDLTLPARTYTISPVPHAFYCLELPGGVRIHGAGQGK